jgi:hypothetical protein
MLGSLDSEQRAAATLKDGPARVDRLIDAR